MSPIKYITLEEEMKKNSELKMSDIQILGEWCKKQPHLPKIQDMQLAIFLHRNYYRIEPTKNTIENYFTIRTHVPEFFSNRDILKVKELRDNYKVMPSFFVKEKTKEGHHIMIGRFLNFEPSRFFFNDCMKFGIMGIDEFLGTQNLSPGFIYILDATGVTMGHIGRVTLIAMKKALCYILNGYPIRLMAVHIINTSPITEIFFNTFKAIMKPEFIEILHFHSSLENVSKYFPIDALPNECGGKAGLIQELMNLQMRKLENFREWYLEDEKINRVNESLRIGKSEISNDLFGVEGSFKKLEVD